MPKPKMNPDEVGIGAPVVARLVATQFPQWGHLPLAEVRSAGTDNTIYRLGGGLAAIGHRVRGEIADLGADGTVNPQLATAAWEAALAAPAWDAAPVWVHADLYPVNLLARHGRLAAVIDFGGLGVGDPAIDLLPAWAWLTTPARGLFRAQAKPDDAAWARGRGWALGLGLGAIHYYRRTNPVLAAIGQHAAAEAIADYQQHLQDEGGPSDQRRA